LVCWFALAVTGLAVAGCDAVFPRPTVAEQGLVRGLPILASGTASGVYWEARGAWQGQEWCLGVATATHASSTCEAAPEPVAPLRVITAPNEIAFLYGAVLDEAARVSVTFAGDRTVQPMFVEVTGPVDLWVLPVSPQDRGQEVVVEAFDVTGAKVAAEELRSP
jgi:hypothetical protein